MADARAPGQDRPLPLAGVRVVEFVHMVMGPSCGLVLADLDAEVIKPHELFDDPHLNASDAYAEVTLADGRRVRTPKLPFAMDGRRFGAELDVPAPGVPYARLAAWARLQHRGDRAFAAGGRDQVRRRRA